MAIALSHGGTTMYSSEAPAQEVLVGTREGVVSLVRDAGGSGWRAVRQTLVDKHISAIIVEPESGLVLAGAYHGSLHASTDGGSTWERRDEGLSQDNVYSLAAARVDGRVRLFAGTEPAHLFYSDDLGLHWHELPALRDTPRVAEWTFPAPPHVGHAKHITFDPTDTRTMYISIEQGGLLKSTDGGGSFQEVTGMDDDVHRLVIHPRQAARMYVTGGDGLYATTDGGASWEHWTARDAEIGGYPDMLVFDPEQPELMFIAAAQHGPGAWHREHFAGARVSRSRDGGRTWETLDNGLPNRLQASIEAMCLEAAGGTCSLFAATTAGEVYWSDDSGDHWSLAITGLAPISKAGHYLQLLTA
jgi:photosystem II stability/assembly factor-like uncharacterized protein